MFPKSKREAVQDKQQLFREVDKEKVGHSSLFIYTFVTKVWIVINPMIQFLKGQQIFIPEIRIRKWGRGSRTIKNSLNQQSYLKLKFKIINLYIYIKVKTLTH